MSSDKEQLFNINKCQYEYKMESRSMGTCINKSCFLILFYLHIISQKKCVPFHKYNELLSYRYP